MRDFLLADATWVSAACIFCVLALIGHYRHETDHQPERYAAAGAKGAAAGVTCVSAILVLCGCAGVINFADLQDKKSMLAIAVFHPLVTAAATTIRQLRPRRKKRPRATTPDQPAEQEAKDQAA